MTHSVNLLPPNVLRRELLHRRARQWGTLWALAVAVAVALGAARWVFTAEMGEKCLDAGQRQNERLAKSERRLAEVRSRLADLREQEAILVGNMEEASGLFLLGVVGRCSRLAEGDVHVEVFALSKRDAAPAVRKAPADREERVLTLRGIASDTIAVAAFAAALRDTGVFSSVERRTASVPNFGEQPVAPYWIECRF